MKDEKQDPGYTDWSPNLHTLTTVKVLWLVGQLAVWLM